MMAVMDVVLAEDSVLLREGLVRLLEEAGHRVVAAVDDADAVVPAVHAHRPDVLIADVRMPPTFTDDGIRAAVEARRALPGLGVLVLSQYVERSYADQLFAGGAAAGYLLKDRIQDLDALADALERIASGGVVLDPDVVSQLLVRPAGDDAFSRLTDREREVLGLMAEGRSNGAVAETLVVSAGAVEKHISNIFAKLDIHADGDTHRRVLAVLAYLGHCGR